MKKRSVLIIVVVLVGILVFGYFFLSGSGPKYKWHETYKAKSKQPYGTYVIHRLLKRYFPKYKFYEIDNQVSESLPRVGTDASYVFVGNTVYLDSTDISELLEFVHRGNTAFFSVNYLPNEVFQRLDAVDIDCVHFGETETFGANSVRLSFFNEELAESSAAYHYQYVNDTNYYYWLFVNDTCMNYYEVSATQMLGYAEQENKVNYVWLKYGKGSILLHTTPLAFTNYHLLEMEKLEYAEAVFSQLPEGDIYWDEFSRIPPPMPQSDGVNMSESPLRFILSQPSLRWAWYLLLAMVILYVIFRAKRRQRVIPILEPNTNTSLEFVETIGRLYYLQNDHKKLGEQKMKLFLEFVRNRYNIPTQNVDDELLKKLTMKSQLPEKEVKKIFDNYKAINYMSEVSESLLIKFHQSIEYFYKNCK